MTHSVYNITYLTNIEYGYQLSVSGFHKCSLIFFIVVFLTQQGHKNLELSNLCRKIKVT